MILVWVVFVVFFLWVICLFLRKSATLQAQGSCDFDCRHWGEPFAVQMVSRILRYIISMILYKHILRLSQNWNEVLCQIDINDINEGQVPWNPKVNLSWTRWLMVNDISLRDHFCHSMQAWVYIQGSVLWTTCFELLCILLWFFIDLYSKTVKILHCCADLLSF